MRQAVETGEPPLTVWAWRDYGVRPVALPERRRFEDEDDLNESVKLGYLDIEPAGRSEGWLLHITVADELVDHLPDDADVAAGPEEIEVAMFWQAFKNLGPDTVLAEVSAESKAAKRRFDQFLADLEARYG